MKGPWLLGSLLLVLTVMKAVVGADVPGPPSPWLAEATPEVPAAVSPPAFPASPPDAKTPETILQLLGITNLSSCGDMQQLFSNLLDSANIFSRNQLCYIKFATDSDFSVSTSSGDGTDQNVTQTQNQTQTQNLQQLQEVYWFTLSAVLPNSGIADRAITTMGHSEGLDIDTFFSRAGVPCDDRLIATTLTEDQDTASVYVYSCNGMVVLPGGSTPLTLPSLCCMAKPKPPRQNSPPPSPPLSLQPPGVVADMHPIESPPPSPVPFPPRPVLPPPPPPGTIENAQLTLFVMAPPERLFCSKLVMACETLAEPYGLASGSYSCFNSSGVRPSEARYGATATISAASIASNGSTTLELKKTTYVIVKAAWSARAYTRSFRRLQSALGSSIDVFASLGFVQCGTEIRALLLSTSGDVHKESVFGCISSLPDDYKDFLVGLGLDVVPRQQLCCRPPPPPPLPPPRPPPPPRQPPLSPPSGPSRPLPPFSPAPVPFALPAEPLPQKPPPVQSRTQPGNLVPNQAGGGQSRPPSSAKDGSPAFPSTWAVAAPPGKGSTSQVTKPAQTQVLSHEAVAVIAVLAVAAVVSILAALYVLYRRRQQTPRCCRNSGADGGDSLPTLIGCSKGTDGIANGSSGGPAGGQPHQPPNGASTDGGWAGKVGIEDAKAQVERARGGDTGGGGPGGGILAMTVSGSSSLTDHSSSADGLPAMLDVRSAVAGPARAATTGQLSVGARAAGPYVCASLGLRSHDDGMGDSVAFVRTLLHGSQRQPQTSVMQLPLLSTAAVATTGSDLELETGAAATVGLMETPSAAAWSRAVPDDSGFGFMDVFRGAAANHICLSDTSSAEPSATGILTVAGVPRNNPLFAATGGASGGGDAGPLIATGDHPLCFPIEPRLDSRPWYDHWRYDTVLRQRGGDDGAGHGDVIGCLDPPGASAAGMAGTPARAGHKEDHQQQRLGGHPGGGGCSGVMAIQAREVTLLDLFNQSPLAGAMLSTPSTSSGGAPPSPLLSGPQSRLLSSSKTDVAAVTGSGTAEPEPSLSPLRQRSSPAIALERLSVQLARNIARLSYNGDALGDPSKDDGRDKTANYHGQVGASFDGRRMDSREGHHQPRGKGRRRAELREPASGQQLRRPHCATDHTGGNCVGKAAALERYKSGARRSDRNNSGGGSSSSGDGDAVGLAGTASLEVSVARSTGTWGTVISAGGVPSLDWGLSAKPSSLVTGHDVGQIRGAQLMKGQLTAAEQRLNVSAAVAAVVVGKKAATRPAGAVDATGSAAERTGTPGRGGGSGVPGGGTLTPPNGGVIDQDISPKELRIQTDGLLGAGAFGSVYRGSYRGQPVAIKVLHHLHFTAAGAGGAGGAGMGGGAAGAQLQQKDVDSFRQEIAILRMLAHPNIVRVLGGCAHVGHPFLVMELMPRCLHNVIHGAAGLTLPDALRIATDVARGLAHLHPAIVHRDLKPANILLDGNGTAKISDFGLARYHLKPYISTQQPDAGSVAYMAPEGFDPAIGRLSAKCDVYSFGVLLWELITQQHPWAGESNVAIIYRVAVLRMRLAVPTDPRVCPPRLALLLDACMSYLPSGRPNMRYVLLELESMLQIVRGEGGVEALIASKPAGGGAAGSGEGAVAPPAPTPTPATQAPPLPSAAVAVQLQPQ